METINVKYEVLMNALDSFDKVTKHFDNVTGKQEQKFDDLDYETVAEI